jgi:REP element-mobilizing transposase RayT
MGHSLSSVHVHFIFSTKNRLPLLAGNETAMFAYLGGIVRELEGKAVIVGGLTNHVHMLVRMPNDVGVSDFMRVVKANSSRWIRQRKRDFGWQTGFAAFSVSMSVLPEVTRYIREQEKHHRKMTFQQELLALLKKHGIEYDERYIWA